MTGTTLIFESFLDPTYYKTFQYIIEFIERFTGIPTFLLHGESIDDLAAGYADAGFVSALSYVQLLSQNPRPVELSAIPALLDAPEQDALPSFFDIVVRKESRLDSLNDLEYCTWTYSAALPHIEDQFMHVQGIPTIHFRETVEASSQAESLRFVLNGKADATAIDSRMLDIILRNSPRIAAQLRTLGTYSDSHVPFVVVAPHVSTLLKKKIREAFLAIHRDRFFVQRLQEGQIERFIPATNQHYQHFCERNRREQAQGFYIEATVETLRSAHML